MMRYTRYVHYVWLNDLNNVKEEHRRSFDKQLTPQTASELTLQYIHELTFFTSKYYTNVLYNQLNVKQNHDLWEYLKIKTTDVVFLSSLFNVTMNII